MTNFKYGNLFSQEEWDAMIPASYNDKNATVSNGLGVLHHRLCENLSFTGKYQMPVVQPVTCPVPNEIVAYYRTATKTCKGCVSHFYTSDTRIERIWKQPNVVLNQLLHEDTWVIGPDFSVYANLLFPQKTWNIFRNKLIVAWWQYSGVKVIPNISWVNYDYDLSFDGWPRESVIAVNSTGVGNSNRCKAMWIDGYREMIKRLSPIRILRYGAKQDGENEEISRYYENDNKKFSRHGR